MTTPNPAGPQALTTDPPRVVLPDPQVVFAARATRFAQLAAGHAMGDYLALMGELALAQHETLGRRAPPPIDETALAQSRAHGMPPLSALGHVRHTQWHDDLDDLVTWMSALPAASALVSALAALDAAGRESLAERILAGETVDADATAVPLVAAALQTYFTRLAISLDVATVLQFDTPGVCPVCATRPVASVVRQRAGRDRLRYLCCALCSTEWNLARIQCSACGDEKGVHYLSLQPDAADAAEAERAAQAAARRAEACDACKSYLKIFHQDKDPDVEPMADDLASLSLDIAVDAQGYARSGPNLLLHPGAA